MHLNPLSGVTRWVILSSATGAWLLLGSICSPEASAAPAVSNSECLECHKIDENATDAAGVREGAYARSVHGSMDCVDCHTSITEASHETPLPKVQCASCHSDVGETHPFHSRLSLTETPSGDDTSCKGCHGTHEIAEVKSREFGFSETRQTEWCGRCHEKETKDYLASAHSTASEQAPDCLTCHSKPIAGKATGEAIVKLKLAQAALCESCHTGDGKNEDRRAHGGKFVASFDSSVHGAALNAGKGEAANCVDCHGAHEMNKAAVAGALVNPIHITDTCAKCHAKEADEYRVSVHAEALRAGNTDSAGCTSCHGEHNIKPPSDPTAPVNKTNLAQKVCADCHTSVRLTTKYGLSSDTFKTFEDSYHGLAVRGGGVDVVNCASCHGAHAIRSQDDPLSSTNSANIARTCGECHPGANERFAVGKVHASAENKAQSPILYWISTIYTALIVVVIGGMVLHNFLDFLKKARRKLAIQKGWIVEEPVAHRLYLRMTVHERIQHAILGLSFTALVVTGFMLRYPEAWWVEGIRSISSNAFELRSLGHRVAGVIMMALAVWHVGYLLFTKPGRKLLADLLPTRRDLTDPGKVLRYNLGLAKEKPRFGRFCYIEKAEYWAMVWGTILMGVTGIILWFYNISMGHITKLGFDVALTIHFYEAILATLAIIVWHFYWVIYNPDVYPMNLSWLTGRMSEEEMSHEHPLQLEEMKRNGHDHAPGEEAPDPHGPPRQPGGESPPTLPGQKPDPWDDN